MTIFGSLLVGIVKSNCIHSIKTIRLKVSSRLASNEALHNLLINMPKEPVHLAKLKGIRKDKRENTVKYPAGFINLQVLGNGSRGAPTSLYIFTDQTRYLFNCGEGTQRLAHEHKMKLAKLEHIFITSKLWSRIGGLPGLVLTIQDIGVPSVTIHGPPQMDQLFEGTRGFVILKDLQIRTSDCTNTDVTFYEDHVMRVDYVPLYGQNELTDEDDSSSSSDEESIEDDTDYYANAKAREVGSKRPFEIVREEFKGKKARADDEVDRDCSLCYVCRPKEKPGTLVIEKCIERGVPAGPLLGKLKSGEDVTLPNGKLVKAEDVTTPHDPGPVFIIVDCPHVKYLDSLVENEAFTRYQSTGADERDTAHVVAHFTPKLVMEHPKYTTWMEKFRPTTKHLLLNDLCDGTGSEAVHRVQYKLNQLDEEIFPLLGEAKMPVKDVDDLDVIATHKPSCFESSPVSIVLGTTLQKFNLRPIIGAESCSGVTLNPKLYIQETKETENFSSDLDKYKTLLKTMQNPVQDFPKLLFLGTGSCIPNKTRNTSGILVQLNKDSSILLDCGEGTFGQMVRFFGKEKSDEILVSLKAVYVSHLHADHHLGLVNVILERAGAFKRLNMQFYPISLIAPYQILSWLKLFHKTFEKIKLYYELIGNSSLNLNDSSIEPAVYKEKILEPLDLSSFQTVGVRHCPNAFGVSFSGNSNWKLTYSGDTMPCDYLVTLGQNSDVLIHEATMEDELQEEAVYKMHSTTSEAIGMGKKMNAKFTILTHFSQRYSKVPKIGNELEQNVGIAFDNMYLRLSDLPKIPLMYPTLKTLFAEHYEEMEIKTAKKMKRKEKLLGASLLDNNDNGKNNAISGQSQL